MVEFNLLEDYLDRAACARMLGKSPRTLQLWERRREGPPVTYVGRRALYYVPSLRDWIREQERHMPRSSRRARRRDAQRTA
jgi:hypothetical protein